MMTSSKLVCRQMFWRMLTICHFVNQWVRGTVLQKMIKLLIFFFHLLIEPQFVDWVVLQTNLYAEQRQEQLQRRDICGRFY